MQVIAETREKRDSRSMPGQEPLVRKRIQRAKEAQSMNEIVHEGMPQEPCAPPVLSLAKSCQLHCMSSVHRNIST